jgi:hypothetical protein
MEHKKKNSLERTYLNDNLNDSIGSEFYDSEEKSISDKIRDHPKLKKKTLFNTTRPIEYKNLLNNRGLTQREFTNKINFPCANTNSNDYSRMNMSVNFTRNGIYNIKIIFRFIRFN